MSRNIKEIGKELMGKSLNSFHRKTGLTQLEENNKMQDGILDGILSQVDDAYIEKTEQSNVLHLDGSGDGVVVVDGIEGNTMVNLWNFNSVRVNGQAVKTDTTIKIKTTDNRWSNFFLYDKEMFKPSTEYTFIIDVKKNTLTDNSCIVITSSAGSTDRDVFEGYHIGAGKTGIFKKKLTTISDFSQANYGVRSFFDNTTQTLNCEVELNIIILEGDWTNKEIPASYFTGLQSSFEEKVNDEGKYEIEILMKNKNLIPIEYKRYESYIYHSTYKAIKLDKLNPNETYKLSVKTKNGNLKNGEYICISPTINPNHASSLGLSYFMFVENGIPRSSMNFSPQNNGEYYLSFWHNGGITKETFNNMMNEIEYIQLEKVNSSNKWEQPKQNKIKLLLNEPLRKSDRLCIKDNKLMVERNVGQVVLNNLNCNATNTNTENVNVYYFDNVVKNKNFSGYGASGQSSLIADNKKTGLDFGEWDRTEKEYSLANSSTGFWIFVPKNIVGKEWLASNPTTVIYPLAQSEYEEVLNEYGEPILLEGYENGTIYIDSTIVPTTTVRYTPKMESFKTLKEVENNNIMLTNDVNDNIIPYMMDVDLMIMEKEMALMSHKNIRTIGVKDMTSMQKRTQDMLTRLIKGKTLTEQECKTRVVTYLDAGKITDAQAEELMLLISEVYA